MRFRVDQEVPAPPAKVVAAFADPGYYAQLTAQDDLAVPELVDHQVHRPVTEISVRYRFTGHLPPAARRILDPDKLTWVARSQVDVAARSARFELLPDVYAQRLSCSGSYRFEEGPGGTLQVVEGDLVVHVPLVGRPVEHALVGGMRRYLAAEAGQLAAYARRRRR